MKISEHDKTHWKAMSERVRRDFKASPDAVKLAYVVSILLSEPPTYVSFWNVIINKIKFAKLTKG